MSAAGARYMGKVAAVGCIICRRMGFPNTPAEVHHVAEGSGKRSDFMTVGLCPEHHRGKTGFHGMGERAFCAMYRPPNENEYGLLAWQAEALNP